MSHQPILPTLRSKRRYILVKTEIREEKEFREKIREIVKFWFGLFGLGESGLMFPKGVFKNGYGIIRVNLEYLDKVLFALGTSYKYHGLEITPIKVSGTLKKLKKLLELSGDKT